MNALQIVTSMVGLGIICLPLLPMLIFTFVAPQTVDDLEGPPQPLTKGEAAALSRFFGDIDTDIVRRYDEPVKWYSSLLSIRGAALGTDAVFFVGEENQSDDFSADIDPGKVFVFWHELTHIRQAQTGMRDVNSDCKAFKYEYEMTANARWEDFCVEQQASIVGDYARAFMLDKKHSPVSRSDIKNADAAYYANLQRVVETKFPGAGALRMDAARKRAPAGAGLPTFSNS